MVSVRREEPPIPTRRLGNRLLPFLTLLLTAGMMVSSRRASLTLGMGRDPHDYEATANAPFRSRCLEEAVLHLPIGEGNPVSRAGGNPNGMSVWAHHYDAGRMEIWNGNDRLRNITELSSPPCSFWEVGAHTQAADTRYFLGRYPECDYHAYEPIPLYYEPLARLWKATANVQTHNYGVGKEEGRSHVPNAALDGLGTYIGDAKITPGYKGIQDYQSVTIKSFDAAVQSARGRKPTVLHVNCEGCEWTMVPEAVEAEFVRDIPVIQISFHNYGAVGLGRRVIQYCEIQEQLSRTHDRVIGVPFGWERWVLKK